MKVKFVPFQPHCFSFGGFEIQMLSTLEAVKKAGVEAEKIDPWSRDSQFDILHLWGLEIANQATIKFAKNAGKKVVVTALLSYFETLEEKIRNLASTFIGPARIVRDIVPYLDGLVVVNDLQKEIAIRHYGVSEAIIKVIPHVVDDAFFQSQQDDKKPEIGGQYILCAGNLCKRKNQLKLVQACLAGGHELVLVGATLHGEEAYAQQIQELIRKNGNIRWIPEVKANSPELVELYRRAKGFALCSYGEQQPISALEAAACGKPLLLGARKYAQQIFYKNACTADPNSVAEIEKGIQKIKANPDQFKVPVAILEQCRESHVGNSYRELYRELSN
jgi:glycosyltransferase involved in cell wall biosynthesis